MMCVLAKRHATARHLVYYHTSLTLRTFVQTMLLALCDQHTLVCVYNQPHQNREHQSLHVIIGRNFIQAGRRRKILNLKSEMREVCTCKTRFLRFARSSEDGGLWWGQEKNLKKELVSCWVRRVVFFYDVGDTWTQSTNVPWDYVLVGKFRVCTDTFLTGHLPGESPERSCHQGDQIRLIYLKGAIAFLAGAKTTPGQTMNWWSFNFGEMKKSSPGLNLRKNK